MKNLQSILIAFTLIITISITGLSQSYETFLKYEGVETLAGLAHPTSTFQSGSYTIYENALDVTMKFTDGVTTKVRLYVNKGWVSDMKVLYDNDWWPPFSGIELIKDVLYEMIKKDMDTSNQVVQAFEQHLGRPIQNCSGKQFSGVVMTLAYFAY